MSNSESHIDPRVSDYVRGKLSGEILVDFEAEMADDLTLQEQVAEEQMAFEFFVDLDVIDLKRTMETDLASPDKSNGGRRRWLFIVLFGCTLIGSLTWFFWPYNEDGEPVLRTSKVIEVEQSEKIQIVREESKASIIPKEKEDDDIVVLNEITSPEIVEETIVEKDELIDLEFAETHIEEVTVEKESVIVSEPSSSNNDVNKKEDIDPCSGVSFTGSIKTKASTVGEENGAVLIESARIKGGVDPYSFSLRLVSSQDEINRFDELAKGSYRMIIIDGNDCQGELVNDLVVEETFCSDNYQPTFNTAYQNEWKVPIVEGQSVHVTLVNRVGQVLIDQRMNSNARGIWNGILDNGQPAVYGAYKWFIEYDTGEKCLVNLTILN